MDCKEAQVLTLPYILGDLDPDSRQCRELEAHLLSCQACAEEYENSKWVVEFIQEHKVLFAEAFETIDKKRATEQEKIKRSWQAIQAKLVKIKAQEKRAKLRRVLWRATAAAACVVIGISAWLVLSNSKTLQKPTPQQIALAPTPSIKIELLLDNGNIIIPAGTKIKTTANELKTLIINGKHRMMINTNTSLSIEPLVKNSNIGCLIKLASGQIYTHVQHDGNPFAVSTAHGKAVITGTTFDVKVTDDSTTLVVSEGTVQFESENGAVKVAAGQTSEIVGQSAPSIPLSCNTAELTAWATGYSPEDAFVQANPAQEAFDITGLPLSLAPEPIVLEETDYDHWVEQKRDWCKQNFPWIFKLKNSLAKEGIEVDYPELLIQTDDVWQFVFLETVPARFSVINPNSLIKTASNYGFNKQWLLENLPAVKSALAKPVLLENSLTGLKAFEQWNSSFEDVQKSSDWVDYDDQYSLFHASVYLTETRSLIWFGIINGKYSLTDKERAEVLALLQKQVNAAIICQENALHQPYKKEQLCDPVARKEDKWYKWADVITKNIKVITSVEEKIVEYEICK